MFMEIADRIMPQNIEAEQAVLGSMLLDSESVFVVMEILKPEDFYEKAHQIIYEAVLSLTEQNEAVDLVTVTEELRRKGLLESVGGASYLTSLANIVPSAANAEYYAKIVLEKSTLRSLIKAANHIANRCYEEAYDIEDLLDDAEQRIFEIAQRRNREGFSTIKEVIKETYEIIERLSQHKEEVTGIPTFKDLDKLLCGLQQSDLIICAARPGMGKTSFCLNIAHNAAVNHNYSVAIFSLEMSKEQVVQRLLASEAMIDQQKLRTGRLNEDEWKRLIRAMGPLSEAPIYIDDTPMVTALEIKAKARRLKADKGLDLVIVDYLQLMQGHRRADSRQQEIAQISRALKGLARELKIPVMALSQLNRGVEQRQDKRPIMADLLESGAIEADADVVLFLYRDEYYNKNTDKKGIAEVIVGKHRNGPVGVVELAFLPQYTKFVNLAKDMVPEG
ncbi:MAG TPA: replicative DNA helicase [Peptococcaceae bacterium]|nr:replicative DNA helicase [Peptococcaceae bacterium]